ncbi:MAG: succinate dehydrogenase, hydrophobic membrane anchor protein [Methylophilaceae bacterium]|nr:succinate dehydrogenase, hydrophobic membrane anchor protein [Methylophilaceae bacterium]
MIIELLTSKYPGMRIWLSQRITAVVMAVYSVLLIVALLIVSPDGYAAWSDFASSFLFRISTFLFFICLSVHAWIGVRDVLRDYIFNQTLRTYLQVMVDLLLVIYVVWLSIILWGL